MHIKSALGHVVRGFREIKDGENDSMTTNMFGFGQKFHAALVHYMELRQGMLNGVSLLFTLVDEELFVLHSVFFHRRIDWCRFVLGVQPRANERDGERAVVRHASIQSVCHDMMEPLVERAGAVQMRLVRVCHLQQK